ncbi:MAG: tetratricopeptide repeat protein [Deferribacterales bacterium]
MDEINRSKYLNDIEYFSRKLEEDPASKLFMPLSVALLKLNKYDDVIYYCAHGLEHFPELLGAKTVMAQAYMGKGKVEDAKGLLKQVILVNRFNYKANKLMGDIYRAESDIERALEYYRKAYKISPEDRKLGEDIEELENLLENGLAEAGDIDLPDRDSEILVSMAEELADEVKDELSHDTYEDKELADDEIEKTFQEIAEKSTEDEDGFDMDDFGKEDFEEEIRENLLASVDEEIKSKEVFGDVVRLDAEDAAPEVQAQKPAAAKAPEPESFADEPIELDEFSAEIEKAEDDAVMSMIGEALSGFGSASYGDEIISDTEKEHIEDSETEEKLFFEAEEPEYEQALPEEEPPAEPEPEEAEELIETEELPEEELPSETEPEEAPAEEEAVPEPEAVPVMEPLPPAEPEEEKTSDAEHPTPAPEPRQLTPQEKLAEAKRMLIEAQVETLENTLACVINKARKRKQTSKEEK